MFARVYAIFLDVMVDDIKSQRDARSTIPHQLRAADNTQLDANAHPTPPKPGV